MLTKKIQQMLDEVNALLKVCEGPNEFGYIIESQPDGNNTLAVCGAPNGPSDSAFALVRTDDLSEILRRLKNGDDFFVFLRAFDQMPQARKEYLQGR
jgi:hypothetical protein